MANDNIFQQYLTKPKSVLEYTAEMDQADARRQSLQQNALELAAGQQKMGDYQREREGENQLSRLLSAGGTPDQVAAGLAQAGYGKQALAYTKQQQELANSKATAGHLDAQSGKLKSETGKLDFEQRESKRQKAITDIAAFTDAQQAATSLQLHIAAGDIDPAQGQMIMQTIPQNPADFPKWQIGMLQRIMAAKDSAAQIAPDAGQVLAAQTQTATNAATNATSRANNAATVRASMANAGATREVAAATRDAATIRRDQETEMKLGDDYRKQSKEFKDVGDAYRQIQVTLDKATTSPAATLAGATKFMKLLDPGSVVRESELGMALAATGAFDRAANYVESLKYGKVLTQQQVNDFKGITAQIYKAAQVGQQQIDASYTKQAKTYKLRPEMIVQDLGQNAPAGGNDVLSAADAILKGGK